MPRYTATASLLFLGSELEISLTYDVIGDESIDASDAQLIERHPWGRRITPLPEPIRRAIIEHFNLGIDPEDEERLCESARRQDRQEYEAQRFVASMGLGR